MKNMRKMWGFWALVVITGLGLGFAEEAGKAPKKTAASTVITPTVPANVQDEYAKRVIEILRLELQAKNVQSQALTKNDELRTYLQGQMEKVCGVGGTFTEDAGKLVCLPPAPKK